MQVDLSAIRSRPNLLEDLLGDDNSDDDQEIDHIDLNGDGLSVPELIQLIRSPSSEDREEALAMLAEQVDKAFGEDGARLGMDVRASGGVALLAWLLADPDEGIQQTSLMILGNLCSDSVDPHSKATKEQLLPHARSVFACAYTEDAGLLLFACGALQNLTSERAWAEYAQKHDVHLRLESLCQDEDGRIVRYASGALRNITHALGLDDLSETARHAIKERSMAHVREGAEKESAKATLSRAVQRIPAEKRQQWHERGSMRRRDRRATRMDTESNCSTSTWSYEIGPFVRSRSVSRPASACSHTSERSAASGFSHTSSCVSYLTAKSMHAGDGMM